MPGVADPVDRRDRDHRAGHRDEPPAQRVDGQVDPGQRQQPRQPGGETGTGQRGHARHDAGHPDPGRAQTYRGRAPPGRDHDRGEHARTGQDGRRRQPSRNRVHRPVSPRNAATIASGAGGHPGTSTSTGTTSATAPCTPYAPANSPQFRAQSPTATTIRGSDTAS